MSVKPIKTIIDKDKLFEVHNGKKPNKTLKESSKRKIKATERNIMNAIRRGEDIDFDDYE